MRWIFVLALAWPASSLAQDEVYGGVGDWSTEEGEGEAIVEAPQGDYPMRYTLRPLTLNRMRIRGDAMFMVFRKPEPPFPPTDNVATGLFVGAGIGVTDDLEVGISAERTGSTRTFPLAWPDQGLGEGLLPFHFSPDFDFGDLPVYGRYRFLATDLLQIAADLTLVVPTNTDFQMRISFPVRLMLADAFVIDTGVTFGLVFGESPRDPTDDFFGWMEVPLRIEISPIEALTIGVHTGFRVIEFDSDLISIPLGLEAIFSMNLGPMLADIVVGFEFPFMLVPGAPNDKSQTGFWILNAGFRVHFQP